MARRPITHTKQADLVTRACGMLELEPTLDLETAAERLEKSRSTVQRAFRALGTSFAAERQARQLDRAANKLLDRGGRQQKEAMLSAGNNAGGRRTRHMCDPFRRRYGVLPAEVWRIGLAVNDLRAMKKKPAPHSRHQHAAYKRYLRRRNGHLDRLHDYLGELEPGTVVHDAVIDVLIDYGEAARLRAPDGPAVFA